MIIQPPKINSASGLCSLMSEYFEIRFVCKFTSLSTKYARSDSGSEKMVKNAADENTAKGIDHHLVQVPYGIDVLAIAHNWARNIDILLRFDITSEVEQILQVKILKGIIQSGNAVLVSSDTYTIDTNGKTDPSGVVLLDPFYRNLRFKFET